MSHLLIYVHGTYYDVCVSICDLYRSAHFQMLKSEKAPLPNNTTSKSSTLFFEDRAEPSPTQLIGIMAQKMMKTKILFKKVVLM